MFPKVLHPMMVEETRRPKSVRGWLLWVIDQRSRRMVRSQSMGGTGGPISDETRADNELLYALVMKCLVANDEEHDREMLPLGEPAQAERRIEELLRWTSTSAAKGEAGGELVASNAAHRKQAADLGLGDESAARYFGYVESVLRRRMKARGLLE